MCTDQSPRRQICDLVRTKVTGEHESKTGTGNTKFKSVLQSQIYHFHKLVSIHCECVGHRESKRIQKSWHLTCNQKSILSVHGSDRSSLPMRGSQRAVEAVCLSVLYYGDMVIMNSLKNTNRAIGITLDQPTRPPDRHMMLMLSTLP